MCGICGIAGTSSPDVRTKVHAMNRFLERRGPDAEGEFRSGVATLGHRRLAIFDLSAAGNQPMTTPDGNLAVVFNGAIYNFHELRDELASERIQWASRTDTEVLLHGYRVWGIDALVRRLRGMFAFALWDAAQEKLLLVRDRLGVKPLVYVEQNGVIAFASSMRALRASGYVGQVAPHGVAAFLEHGYVPESTAIYEGAHKLPPASIGEWRRGTPLSVRSYWQPPEARPTGAVRFEDAVEQTESLLREATRLRLFADVPVGSLLSGGIDSALVCWAAAQEGADVSAFTIGIPGHPGDETSDALATAREIGIDVEVLAMSGEDRSDLTELATAYGEPFATQSALGMLRLSRAIRDAGIKVVLTGDGGDDVFLGYERHRQMLAISRAAGVVPPFAAGAWRAVRRLVPRAGVLRRLRHATDYVTGGLGAFLTAHDGLPGFARLGVLGDRLRDEVPESRQVPESTKSARNLLTDYLAWDLRQQFVGEYLTKVDGATTHYGLEARAPFFDQFLWEYASSLPYETRLHGGALKAVLREIARRRISPRVAAGRKRGFSVPAERWVRGPWLKTVSAQLREGPLCAEGWVTRPGLERALATPYRQGPGENQLWYLVVLDSWLRAQDETPLGMTADRITASVS
jgi:asparagine synthase (glutamine-hydrolysing)